MRLVCVHIINMSLPTRYGVRCSDKDFRYMATSDLLAELQKPAFKPDTDNERKIVKCILKLLNDQSSDVQGLAVKWCA